MPAAVATRLRESKIHTDPRGIDLWQVAVWDSLSSRRGDQEGPPASLAPLGVGGAGGRWERQGEQENNIKSKEADVKRGGGQNGRVKTELKHPQVIL